MSTDVDVSRFREHRTLEECKSLLRFGHISPVSRGFTQRFVAENYPGWTWNELVQVFTAAGILTTRGGAPLTCDDRVVTFHFSSPSEFYVEWINDTEPQGVATKSRAKRVPRD